MELTVKEIRTLQLALLNMEDGLLESGIAKVKALSEKLEQEATRLTKRAADLPCCCAEIFTAGVVNPDCPRHGAMSANR